MIRTTRTTRRTTVLIAASLLALGGVASAVPAHAATPAPNHPASVAVTPRPTTMFIYNHSAQTLQVSVFARIETMHAQTLEPGQVWELPETFSDMNELYVRFPYDPNSAFLGHFAYDAGTFRFLDARAHNLAYSVISGKNHGVVFTTPRAGGAN